MVLEDENEERPSCDVSEGVCVETGDGEDEEREEESHCVALTTMREGCVEMASED